MREKVAVKSSVIGFAAQVITLFLSMICSRVFVQNLGIEIRGINGLLTNCISMLQLAEMGIGTAIIYALYQPLVENNIKEIQILMRFYKKMYFFIGTLIFVLGIGMSFFLDFFITDSSFSISYIRTIFYLQLLGSVSTYLFAYKRNLLYADQKQYINVLFDAVFNMIVTALRIVVIVSMHSYILYLILQIIQNIISNISVSIWCDKHYHYLKDKVVGKYDKMPQLLHNVKNLIIGKIGGFIYSSTDNLIISKFIGIVAVGYMANYYQVSTIIQTLASGITSPIQPMIGNYIREYDDRKKSYELFLSYTFIRYCMANIITTGFILMCNPFIELWLGKQYVLGMSIPILLAVDVFIGMVHGPTGEFISVLGLFENDRNFSWIGMIINLGTSIFFVNYLGVAGVILGTAITQMFYWIARGRTVFSKYFNISAVNYFIKVMAYILVEVIDVGLLFAIFAYLIKWRVTIVSFIGMCIICITVCVCSLIVCFGRTREFNFAICMIKRVANRRKTYDI